MIAYPTDDGGTVWVTCACLDGVTPKYQGITSCPHTPAHLIPYTYPQRITLGVDQQQGGDAWQPHAQEQASGDASDPKQSAEQ